MGINELLVDRVRSDSEQIFELVIKPMTSSRSEPCTSKMSMMGDCLLSFMTLTLKTAGPMEAAEEGKMQCKGIWLIQKSQSGTEMKASDRKHAGMT